MAHRRSSLHRGSFVAISASTSRAGSTVLHGEYWEIDEDRIDELICELVDPERGLPIVVASRDMADPAAASVGAGALASALVVIVKLWGLKGTAISALSKALGPDLHVYGGAVRTYYPDLTIPDRYPCRHRFARRELLIPHPRHGAQVVARAMVTKVIAARRPILFRNRIALMPGFNRHGRDAEELLTELVATEEERYRLQQELDWQVLEAADAADRAESTIARVKWLEKRLVDAGDYVAGLETPASTMFVTASHCVEALDYAKDTPRPCGSGRYDPGSRGDRPEHKGGRVGPKGVAGFPGVAVLRRCESSWDVDRQLPVILSSGPNGLRCCPRRVGRCR